MDQKIIKTAVERAWRDRAKAQNLKPTSSAYKVREVEFVTGAMAAIQAMDPEAMKTPDRLSALVPVGWVTNIMSGQNVIADPTPAAA